MPLLDSVHEQAAQILLNHAEIPMIECNIYNSIPAPPRFFDNQLRVWVHENERRILMHFQTKPHIRILVGLPHLVIWVAKKCFLLIIKHFQAHRNNPLQYEIQQSVFRAKNWRVPPYIIKPMCSWWDQWFATSVRGGLLCDSGQDISRV